MLPAFLGFGNSLMANVQVANLKQDLELIAREVAILGVKSSFSMENVHTPCCVITSQCKCQGGNTTISQLEGRVRLSREL